MTRGTCYIFLWIFLAALFPPLWIFLIMHYLKIRKQAENDEDD